MAEWGVPLDQMELRMIIKHYLDRMKRKVPGFRDNFPGVDFVKSFLVRQADQLKERLADNIRKGRANISRSIANSFFDNISVELPGVPPSNLFNYDETNVSDDPGRKKVIAKRSCKRTERVINHSKSCISVMFCGSASGDILPPYTVYKADHLYDTWKIGGPAKSRYNRSPSGWFDLTTFEDWFETLFLPHVRRLPGKKVLIGDNVASHLSIRVLKLCQENDIKLIFLPPNSTHLLQPLDVSFFGPMKRSWRAILNNWKTTTKGKNATCLDKSQFPSLLSKLMNESGLSSRENMISGFRGTGIFPLDRNKVLEKLPVEDVDVAKSGINAEMIDHLKALRYVDTSARKERKRRLKVPPGKSVSVEDVDCETVAGPSKAKKKKTKHIEPDYEVSNSEDEAEKEIPKVVLALKDLKKNDYVIVNYEGEHFPGKIMSVKRSKNEIKVLTMTKSLKNWKWKESETADSYKLDDVVRKIREPVPVNKRGTFRVEEIESLWGL